MRSRRRLRQLVADDPSFYKGYTSLGRVYAQQGKFLDAIRMLEKGRSLAGDIPTFWARWDRCTRLAARPSGLAICCRSWRSGRETSWVPSSVFAIVHLGWGRTTGRWIGWSADAVQHELPMTSLKVHPVYDGLRGMPRFQAILRQLGME
jgi:serine/threonine-protein kinase